jgi:hypothetical protein
MGDGFSLGWVCAAKAQGLKVPTVTVHFLSCEVFVDLTVEWALLADLQLDQHSRLVASWR